ncbi:MULTISPECIES: ATP-grasp ribosomal peptide maturase [Streptomyces]|uniref:ATP-grasp ribosomal peptide maturase n=1 Tax=Streptomyces TaxID=1883 RepID=UPI0003A587A2|nr:MULTISPECIES: ATP-grasp ribosomal peptide maturase [Streptomyces]MBZ6114581.1 ATP-grasp ribosomal peptide maturase [Streptomyces olivaceus]MBZ6128430.1 ATP-grasp ribosomal peptide maturase [Streptomyces olivaceus]MBZ6149286.1 ATP-grasp ribosomal peptide maturase [Streptomyces olivaceus]MBZ6163194.1 ATP-grasp ribosomal peptide maturase [Streptomyces olivaceus]MBZ6190998.1 ATP-grasp ribosomal peptide maturase [Streptomyces olivaceus]
MSAASPVLVVTRLDDATADVVVEELGRRSVPVVRLDPGDFPVTTTVAARAEGPRLTGEVRTGTRSVALDAVRSVYWRRPRPYSAPDGLKGPDAGWCAQQAHHGLGGILATLPGAHYVNHPWRNRAAEYKPAQLTAAARCGLHVPPTLLTNDVERARQFIRDHGPVVYKPLYNGEYVGPDGQGLTVWVEEVVMADVDTGVAHTMHLFQTRVDKVADVRLTAVGNQLFAVRIDGSPGLDWRRHYDDLHYSLIDTPPDVVKGVHEYLAAFGLTYGAFDFGLDAAGRWHWYECNPNGQFAWFPDPITGRITAALADQLQYSSDRDGR